MWPWRLPRLLMAATDWDPTRVAKLREWRLLAAEADALLVVPSVCILRNRGATHICLSALVYDLISKYRELSAVGDAAAAAFYGKG